jgi:hypothetical protein
VGHPRLDLEVAAAAAWVCEQVASHGQAAADQLVAAGVLPRLAAAYSAWPAAGKGGRSGLAKVKAAVKALVRSCGSSAELQGLLLQPGLPLALARHVLARLVQLLADSPRGRQGLVTSGALQRVLALRRELGGGSGKAWGAGTRAVVVRAHDEVAAEGRGSGGGGGAELLEEVAEVAGDGGGAEGEAALAAAVLQQAEALSSLYPDEVLAYFSPHA